MTDDVVCISAASEASIHPIGLLLHPFGSLLQVPGLAPLFLRLSGEGVGLLLELPSALPGCGDLNIEGGQLGGELPHLGLHLVPLQTELRPEEDSGGCLIPTINQYVPQSSSFSDLPDLALNIGIELKELRLQSSDLLLASFSTLGFNLS